MKTLDRVHQFFTQAFGLREGWWMVETTGTDANIYEFRLEVTDFLV